MVTGLLLNHRFFSKRRARPATGFSMDLRELSRLIRSPYSLPKGILAPYRKNNKKLEKKIEQLRNKNQIVVVDLPNHRNKKDTFNCDRKLVLRNKIWKVVKI